MFFDPVSSGLVALIADGLVISGSNSGLDEYKRQILRMTKESFNKEVREMKHSHGLRTPEETLEQISKRAHAASSWMTQNGCMCTLIIDLDNREYIVDLLEACERKYHAEPGEEAREREAWYKKQVLEARRYKEYQKQCLDQAERAREKDTLLVWALGTVIVIVFLIVLCI